VGCPWLPTVFPAAAHQIRDRPSSVFTASSPARKVITDFVAFGAAKLSSVYDDDEEEEEQSACNGLDARWVWMEGMAHLCVAGGMRAWLSRRVVQILVPPFTYSSPLPLFNYENLFSIDKVTTLDNLVIQLILVFCTFELLLAY
jgi:hypothetical protein